MVLRRSCSFLNYLFTQLLIIKLSFFLAETLGWSKSCWPASELQIGQFGWLLLWRRREVAYCWIHAQRDTCKTSVSLWVHYMQSIYSHSNLFLILHRCSFICKLIMKVASFLLFNLFVLCCCRIGSFLYFVWNISELSFHQLHGGKCQGGWKMLLSVWCWYGQPLLCTDVM